MIKPFILSLLCTYCCVLSAQTDSFTLKQCIEYAWMNNLDVRQYILNSESAKIDARQSKTNLLPTFSASGGQNYQFGRTIDRFTNTFVNQTIRSNNIGISGSLLLFNGFQNQNSIKQLQATERASEENIQTIRNTIALNISGAFLQAIQAIENINNAKYQMESTGQRIIRAQKMVDAGASDLSALLSLKAQLANEQLNLVTAENARRSALLNLKTFMQMPALEDLVIRLPDIPAEIINNPYTVIELYEIALQTMPQIKSAVLQSEATKFQSRLAKGNMAPTISLYGSVSTVYSQSAKNVTNYQLSGSQVIGVTEVGLEKVLQPTYSYQLQTISFSKQLKDNLGQGAGINLSWNLFSGFQVQNQVQKSKINLQISELNLLKAKNTLLNDINLAVNNYEAAKAKFDASRNNVEAQRVNLEYIQKRFDAGATTSFDFIQSKNNYLQAQSNEIQARYELVFRGLILEYYKGNPIIL